MNSKIKHPLMRYHGGKFRLAPWIMSFFPEHHTYVHSTRKMRHGGYYNHEMTDNDHVQLLDKLNSVKGKVVLSGYDSDIYNNALNGWSKYSTSARISAGRGTATRTEVVWLNRACSDQYGQSRLNFVYGLN